MNNRVVYLALACGALSLAANVLGGCGTTATVQTPAPSLTVQTAAPAATAPPMVPATTVVMVGPAWVPDGVLDDVGTAMSIRARQFAAGFAPASQMARATIRQGMEGVMVPGTVQAGYCYRIIAVGGAGVRDLDLFLYDPTGRQVDADRAPDNYPVIGLNRPLCIPPGVPPQSAQLRIRSFTGSGAIGVQMFAQPFNGAMPVAQPVMVGAPGVVYR